MSLSKSRFIEMFGRLGCDDKKWGLVSLGEFCLLNPQKSELHNISDDTEVSFLPMSSVSENGELTLSERKLYRDVKSGFSYFAEGDVLFAKITPCMENGKGAVAHGLCNNIGFGSTEFHVLRAKTSVCNPYWLYELLSLKQFRKIAEQNMTGSAGQKRVPAKFLQNFKLSLPPIELQNEYVSISRQIDKSKFLLQKILEKLELLKKSRFIEMFGDPIKNEKRWAQLTLNSVCDGIGDGLHGTPEYDDSGDFYFINGNNLINGEIVITPSTKKVNEEVFKKYYRNISSNALLLSINGTLGKIAFYNNEAITLGKSACYINLKTFVNKYFVFELMKTDHFLKYLEENSTKSTIKNVSLKTIRNFQLISPPENLQNDFISFSKKIDKSKLVIQKSLEDLVGKS